MIVVLAFVALGCGKSPAPPPDLLGKSVAPPAPLANVRGRTMAEVKKLHPEAKDDPRFSGSPSLMINAPEGLRYTITFYSDIDRVASTHVQAPGHDLTALAKRAWGPGQPSRIHPDWTEWRDEQTGYTATATGHAIEFRGTLPLDAAYFGKAPAMIGSWKTVKLGTPKQSVKPSDEEQPEGVRFDPRHAFPPGDEALESLRVVFPRSVAKTIETAWGAGTAGADGDTLWLDEATGTRVSLSSDGTLLEISPYSTYASLFGDGKASLGRVPVAIEGKPRAQVEAALNQAPSGTDNVMAVFANTKHGSQPHVNCLFFDDKASCSLVVQYNERTKDRDEMFAYLDASWGAPAKPKPDERRFTVAGKKITVSDWASQLSFRIEK